MGDGCDDIEVEDGGGKRLEVVEFIVAGMGGKYEVGEADSFKISFDIACNFCLNSFWKLFISF